MQHDFPYFMAIITSTIYERYFNLKVNIIFPVYCSIRSIVLRNSIEKNQVNTTIGHFPYSPHAFENC